MSEASEKGGWYDWFFASKKAAHPTHKDNSRKVGYDRMDDTCRVDNGPQGTEVTQRSPRTENVYGYGYSTYQMTAPPDSGDYDLQLKRKDRKPRVNSLWARIKYWFRYTWKMFKVGLLASGEGMVAGPMMVPPPMASMTSKTTRHRLAKEPPVADVFM